MTTLTINVDNDIKQKAQAISQKDGATLTFVINQFLKMYTRNEIKFSLVKDDITFWDEEEINNMGKTTNIKFKTNNFN